MRAGRRRAEAGGPPAAPHQSSLHSRGPHRSSSPEEQPGGGSEQRDEQDENGREVRIGVLANRPGEEGAACHGGRLLGGAEGWEDVRGEERLRLSGAVGFW